MSRKLGTKKKVLLSDQISSLFTVAPRADLEDDVVFNTKPTTVSKDDLESDGEGEAALSSFRKQNVRLLADISDKYAGVVSARTQSDSENSQEELLDSGSDEENNDLSNDSVDETVDNPDIDDDDDDDGNEPAEDSKSDDNSDEMSVEDESEEDFDDGFNLSQLNETKDEDFKHMRETNVSEEVSKGRCVKNQLSIWENLLEMRINLQKCLVTANKMPMSETFNILKQDNAKEFVPAIGKTKGNITMLLSRLLDLQSHLSAQFPETKNILNQSGSPATIDDTNEDPDLDEEIPSDSEPETTEEIIPVKSKINRKRKFTDYSTDLSERHTSYLKYRNSVIQKWHDKIKLTAAVSKNQPVTSILSQIDFILGDKNKLIKKTQLKRSKYDIVGCKSDANDDNVVNEDQDVDPSTKNDDEYCSEIFDDDDFYHQLLRELIEHKSADILDPIQLSQQWIALQQLRSKLKRKIDTRATKGRRIRYAVHPKLVNFMAPVKCTEWTDEAKNELFASLFGKQYENNI